MPAGPYGKSIQNTWVARFKGKFHDACPNQHSFIDLAATWRRIEAWKIHYNPIRLAFPLFLSQPQRRIAFHPFLTLDLNLNRASDMFQTAGRL